MHLFYFVLGRVGDGRGWLENVKFVQDIGFLLTCVGVCTFLILVACSLLSIAV